jgi:hypothetical protein
MDDMVFNFGVPAVCPNCGGRDFWRWPKRHPQHDPLHWICWHCAPPLEGTELVDVSSGDAASLIWPHPNK